VSGRQKENVPSYGKKLFGAGRNTEVKKAVQEENAELTNHTFIISGYIRPETKGNLHHSILPASPILLLLL
jgi:hypothetical protein